MNHNRKENESPLCIEAWGWKYHHMGIPTSEKKAEEKFIPQLGMHVSGFPDSPVGVEWMRFEPGSPVNELVRELPHIAFEVPDLDEALSKAEFRLLSAPSIPMQGLRVAMIEHNGVPVEIMEFSD